MLTLAFDTATGVATSALVEDGETLGERAGQPVRLLEDVNELLREADAETSELRRIVVGTGPGSFTSLRMGLAAARALALALDVKVAGVSTLDALAQALRERSRSSTRAAAKSSRSSAASLSPSTPEQLGSSLSRGQICVGDGAIRYRDALEAGGAEIPPDDSELHVPRASLHARLAGHFGPAEEVEPIYVRAPDADRVLE